MTALLSLRAANRVGGGGSSGTWRLPSTLGKKMRSKTKARQALNLTRRKLVPFRLVPLPHSLCLQLLLLRLLLLLVVVVRQISVSSSIRRVIVNALATPAAGCHPAAYVKSAAQNFKTSHVAEPPLPPCPYPLEHPQLLLLVPFTFGHLFDHACCMR